MFRIMNAQLLVKFQDSKCGYGPRIFIPTSNTPESLREALKNASIWGGHDKVEVIDGVSWTGYEMESNSAIIDFLYAHVIGQ